MREGDVSLARDATDEDDSMIRRRSYATASGLNKKTLIDAVAAETGETKASVGRVLNACFDVIGATVQSGDKVAISKFGTFARKTRAARDGRNPMTGAPLKIPATDYPSFSASSTWKDAVAGKK
ncbi:bacterial DNA-binding protein-domain-containing protein [Ostreococcus tauri]|uniref:Bacterial DNA-binding protein-domain-containing protein n=1 Tax=Ostreococcus tauri TaxID=70448 RepID=A0A1Y5I146_OSTTA|nr:bacterial DNA-binding protein-domain-containing protein [Ostreococcus tauri]